MQTPLYSQLESEIIGITKRAFTQLYQPGGMLHKQESAAQITPEDFKITILRFRAALYRWNQGSFWYFVGQLCEG